MRNYIIVALILMFSILGLSEVFMVSIETGQQSRLEGYAQGFRVGFVQVLSNWR